MRGILYKQIKKTEFGILKIFRLVETLIKLMVFKNLLVFI